MSEETPITELTELEAVKVSGVGTPANGTPFLVIKAASETTDEEAEKADSQDDCKTCDGTGKIMDGHRDCPDCDGPATKAEEDGEDAEKAKMSSAEQNDLPDSAFAYIEPGGEKDSEGKTTPRSKRHFPVHDKAHADNAAARIAQGAQFGDKAKAKVLAAQAKFGEDNASKGDVQDALHGTDTPDAKGAIPSGTSGLAGPATSGVVPGAMRTDSPNGMPGIGPSSIEGGQSTYGIPAEAGQNGPAVQPLPALLNKQHAAISFVASSLAEMLQHIAEQRESPDAVKSGDDAREYVEQAFAELVKDMDFNERLAAAQEELSRSHSAGEQTTKAGDDAGSTPSKEDTTMAIEVTKEELAEAIVAGTESATEALKDRLDAIEEALKNANNGGDIDTADVKADGQVDENLGGVPDGGHVNPEYVNKELAEQLGEVVKAAVAAETAPLKELVAKMGKRPRQGGPVLDGQMRPADEGRMGQVAAKSGIELEHEGLMQQLAEATDPIQKAQLGERATKLAFEIQATQQFGDR